jgi:hypothetical protein
VRPHAFWREFFALAAQVSALLPVKTGKDTGEDAVCIAFVASLWFPKALTRLPSRPLRICTNP